MWKKYVTWILILVVCVVALKTFAEGTIRSANPIEPEADQILKRMSQHLISVRHFTFDAYKTVDVVLDSGQMIQLSDTTRVSLSRPDKLLAKSTGDTNNEHVWYDGKTLSVLSPEQNTYATVDVPNTIDEMMDYVVEKYGAAIPLADLAVSDPYKSAIQRVQSGHYLGLHYVRDLKCHHLAFRQQGLDWQVWIEAGDKPLPRKLVITYKELPGHPQFTAVFDNWDMSPRLSDSLFTFKVPRGAKRIEMEPLIVRPAGNDVREDNVQQK
jgi:hypothetical protein